MFSVNYFGQKINVFPIDWRRGMQQGILWDSAPRSLVFDVCCNQDGLVNRWNRRMAWGADTGLLGRYGRPLSFPLGLQVGEAQRLGHLAPGILPGAIWSEPLVVRPGAPSSVLAPSSDARSP